MSDHIPDGATVEHHQTGRRGFIVYPADHPGRNGADALVRWDDNGETDEIDEALLKEVPLGVYLPAVRPPAISIRVVRDDNAILHLTHVQVAEVLEALGTNEHTRCVRDFLLHNEPPIGYVGERPSWRK